MYYLSLSAGKKTRVDYEDLEMLSHWDWSYDSTNGYAIRNNKRWGMNSTLGMHRMIMLPDPGLQVDHINGDRLDNRRCNLRCVTPTQNSWNGKIRGDTKTGYRGVRIKGDDYYTAGFKQGGEWVHIGSYRDPVEAALAADMWAIENRKEHANLNFLRYEE